MMARMSIGINPAVAAAYMTQQARDISARVRIETGKLLKIEFRQPDTKHVLTNFEDVGTFDVIALAGIKLDRYAPDEIYASTRATLPTDTPGEDQTQLLADLNKCFYDAGSALIALLLKGKDPTSEVPKRAVAIKVDLDEVEPMRPALEGPPAREDDEHRTLSSESYW